MKIRSPINLSWGHPRSQRKLKNKMHKYFVFKLNNHREVFETVQAYFMAIYLLLKILRIMCNNSIKPIEKLSRRHFINSFDVKGK